VIAPRFRLAVHQNHAALRDVAGNAARLAAVAQASGADLVLTPELSLTGYDLRDDVPAVALPAEPGEPVGFTLPPGVPDLVVGLVERGADGLPYNAAIHVRDGRVLFRHRKLYLPTYGMFDEMRYFTRGGRLEPYEAGGGWRVGLLVCEDFWHPSLAWLLAVRGIHLLLVLAAGAGRGAWEGAPGGGRFASWEAWERIARTTAQLHGIYLALANRVGVEGGVTFAGGSMICAPTGEILARASDEGEQTITAELDLAEVARARRPYAHLRDEDPRFIAREIARWLEERDAR